jgi:hypothetical protein
MARENRIAGSSSCYYCKYNTVLQMGARCMIDNNKRAATFRLVWCPEVRPHCCRGPSRLQLVRKCLSLDFSLPPFLWSVLFKGFPSLGLISPLPFPFPSGSCTPPLPMMVYISARLPEFHAPADRSQRQQSFTSPNPVPAAEGDIYWQTPSVKFLQ